MNQAPFWLPLWQAADALLGLATQSAAVLPVMALAALVLGRRGHREGFAKAGGIFLSVGLATALLGLLHVAGRAFVSLQILPACMDALVPLPFEPLSDPWLASTTAFLAWSAGILLLLGCRALAAPVHSCAAASLDERTEARMRRLAAAASAAALLATLCFFASLVLRNWPFLGLPEQMTSETVLSVLVGHTWRQCCAALMPAGAFAVLTFYLSLPPIPKEIRDAERKRRREEIIPKTAEQILPLPPEHVLAVRMCAAFALAGAAFQLLDASFLAFSSQIPGMSGARAVLLRFGPFLVNAVSTVCLAFVFSGPRRTQFLLALVPVLLVFLRAAGNF